MRAGSNFYFAATEHTCIGPNAIHCGLMQIKDEIWAERERPLPVEIVVNIFDS